MDLSTLNTVNFTDVKIGSLCFWNNYGDISQLIMKAGVFKVAENSDKNEELIGEFCVFLSGDQPFTFSRYNNERLTVTQIEEYTFELINNSVDTDPEAKKIGGEIYSEGKNLYLFLDNRGYRNQGYLNLTTGKLLSNLGDVRVSKIHQWSIIVPKNKIEKGIGCTVFSYPLT
ncbi:MAG: hypothetical protein R3D86_13740 [Emcibacteraceae bacterium]